MQSFDRYFRSKMQDRRFCALYEAECHVCANTVRIFERVERDGLSLSALARIAAVDTQALTALRDAERCDPHVVMRLCRHLRLPVPRHCPKLTPA